MAAVIYKTLEQHWTKTEKCNPSKQMKYDIIASMAKNLNPGCTTCRSALGFWPWEFDTRVLARS